MSKFYLGRLYEFAIDVQMQVFFELVFNGTDNGRMPVAKVVHADTGNQVKVFFPRCIVDIYAFCMINLQSKRLGGGKAKVTEE